MKYAVTVSPRVSAFAPIIYRGDLNYGLARAAELGFDGVEVNGRIEEIDGAALLPMLRERGLELSALGTGASAIADGVGLSSHDPEARMRAVGIMRRTIDLASEGGAVALLGLIVGRLDPVPDAAEEGRKRALEEIAGLADYAAHRGVRLALEPINRYESNFVNTVEHALRLVERVGRPNVGLLLDTFHMNIEEPSIEGSLRAAGSRVFYLHAADSNRWAPGYGHTDFQTVAAALRDVCYSGWLSAELLPQPDPETAAAKSIEAFRLVFARRAKVG